jgi:EpsD family peptidyl-prolyl cis-trans isomerase
MMTGINVMSFGRMLLLVLLSSVFLAACNHKKEGGETQVVAKVNGDEISIHQINYAMSRMGNIPKGQENEVEKQILKGLVDQQLLVKLAVEKKLDRNPNVVQTIEASKRQILAQASLENMMQQLSAPSDTEIHDYYVKSPELFASHRIYKFAEISMAGTTPLDKVKQLLSGTKSLEEFAGKLKSENIQFKASATVKGAEELPTALLPKFSKMAKGEVAIIPAGDNISVLQLQDFKEQAVSEEQAKAVIGKFLMEQKRKTQIEAEMKKLREAAKIEYLGTFADAGKTPSAKAVDTPTESGKPGDMKDSHMEKGLSGLK